MRKCIKNKNKIQKYANHLNSQVCSHKSYTTRHTMIVDSYDKSCSWFYSLYPDFGVADCNDIIFAINTDYQMYLDWIEDE